jgi:UPF0755 protein
MAGKTRKNRKRRPWYKPRKSRRAQRWALGLVVLSVLGAAFAIWGAYDTMLAYPDRPGLGNDDVIEVEIPRGASFPKVLKLLQEHGVVAEEEATAFKVFVLHHGAANKTTAGRHEFRGDMTPTEILEELQRRQKAQEARVTIPEGKHMLQVADILADAGLGDRKALEAVMRDQEFLARHGIDAPTVEGYLFPDTYKFRTGSGGATPQEIIERLIRRHDQVYDELRKEHRGAGRELSSEFGWGHAQIVTLASIVEKETGVKKERPRIAGVFLNRLRFAHFKPKLLQTDPTIIYGCTVPEEKSAACQQFEGRIRRIHLRDGENPYNTYTHERLPPGPISNPGRAALEAVFAPEKSKYLYFVARNDGTHHFSATRAEHERAVDKYIRGGAVGSGTPQD